MSTRNGLSKEGAALIDRNYLLRQKKGGVRRFLNMGSDISFLRSGSQGGLTLYSVCNGA